MRDDYRDRPGGHKGVLLHAEDRLLVHRRHHVRTAVKRAALLLAGQGLTFPPNTKKASDLQKISLDPRVTGGQGSRESAIAEGPNKTTDGRVGATASLVLGARVQ